MNKKTMNFYSYKLLGLLSLTLLSQPASADLFKCNACPAGYKCDGISKTICPAGTYSQAGAASCTSCSAGTYSNGSGQSSCKSCPAGQYQDASGQTSCKTCSEGTAPNNNKSACVRLCPDGYVWDKSQSACYKETCTLNIKAQRINSADPGVSYKAGKASQGNGSGCYYVSYTGTMKRGTCIKYDYPGSSSGGDHPYCGSIETSYCCNEKLK